MTSDEQHEESRGGEAVDPLLLVPTGSPPPVVLTTPEAEENSSWLTAVFAENKVIRTPSNWLLRERVRNAAVRVREIKFPVKAFSGSGRVVHGIPWGSGFSFSREWFADAGASEGYRGDGDSLTLCHHLMGDESDFEGNEATSFPDPDFVANSQLLADLFVWDLADRPVSAVIHRIGNTLVLLPFDPTWRLDSSSSSSSPSKIRRDHSSRLIGALRLDDDVSVPISTSTSSPPIPQASLEEESRLIQSASSEILAERAKKKSLVKQRNRELLSKIHWRLADYVVAEEAGGPPRILRFRDNTLEVYPHPDLVILRRDTKRITIAVQEAAYPLRPATVAHMFLTNLMANVAELALVVHDNGRIVRTQIVRTPDVLRLHPSPPSPVEIEKHAANLLQFLKLACSEDLKSYWIFKGRGEKIARLWALDPARDEAMDPGARDKLLYQMAMLCLRASSSLASSTARGGARDAREISLLARALSLLDAAAAAAAERGGGGKREDEGEGNTRESNRGSSGGGVGRYPLRASLRQRLAERLFAIGRVGEARLELERVMEEFWRYVKEERYVVACKYLSSFGRESEEEMLESALETVDRFMARIAKSEESERDELERGREKTTEEDGEDDSSEAKTESEDDEEPEERAAFARRRRDVCRWLGDRYVALSKNSMATTPSSPSLLAEAIRHLQHAIAMYTRIASRDEEGREEDDGEFLLGNCWNELGKLKLRGASLNLAECTSSTARECFLKAIACFSRSSDARNEENVVLATANAALTLRLEAVAKDDNALLDEALELLGRHVEKAEAKARRRAGKGAAGHRAPLHDKTQGGGNDKDEDEDTKSMREHRVAGVLEMETFKTRMLLASRLEAAAVRSSTFSPRARTLLLTCVSTAIDPGSIAAANYHYGSHLRKWWFHDDRSPTANGIPLSFKKKRAELAIHHLRVALSNFPAHSLERLHARVEIVRVQSEMLADPLGAIETLLESETLATVVVHKEAFSSVVLPAMDQVMKGEAAQALPPGVGKRKMERLIAMREEYAQQQTGNEALTFLKRCREGILGVR